MVSQEEKFKIEVGNRLKTARNQKNLSRNYVLRILQAKYGITCDDSTLKRYENGEFLPNLEKLSYLVQVLDTSLDYIVYGKRPHVDCYQNKEYIRLKKYEQKALERLEAQLLIMKEQRLRREEMKQKCRQ